MNKFMPKIEELVLLIVIDICCCFLSVSMGLILRYCVDYSAIPAGMLRPALGVCAVWALTGVAVFTVFKLYNRIWKYASINDGIRVITACFVSVAALVVEGSFMDAQIPKSAYIFIWFLYTGITLLTRFFPRLRHSVLNSLSAPQVKGQKLVMVVGAGNAGNSLIREIEWDKRLEDTKVVCVIDDDKKKWGSYLNGVKIVGGRAQIIKATELYGVQEIYFAIPSADNETRQAFYNISKNTHCKLKTLPSVYDMVNGKATVDLLKEVEISDLLGRPQIKLDLNGVRQFVRGRSVLVTGAGGSIGSELCRQLAKFGPSRLVLFDIYENSTYFIQNELREAYPGLEIVTLIGSIRDEARLDYLFRTYKPELVYHAAAHKHVPLMEDSPNEAVKNNVFGTLNVVKASDRYHVKKFVMISTDKAVNPTNIMGATKRVCEMIVQLYSSFSCTEYAAVRFGNVMGSNGSVIPIFKKQIMEGGPVTVTHPDIIRYFMTIPEAVSLVLEAGAYAKGGEIFALDMGKPVKILSLAENMILLSGKIPYQDIDIVFTGLRPGEKKFEELLMAEEGLSATPNQYIFVCKPLNIDIRAFNKRLKELRNAVFDEENDVRSLVKAMVPTYQYKTAETQILAVRREKVVSISNDKDTAVAL